MRGTALNIQVEYCRTGFTISSCVPANSLIAGTSALKRGGGARWLRSREKGEKEGRKTTPARACERKREDAEEEGMELSRKRDAKGEIHGGGKGRERERERRGRLGCRGVQGISIMANGSIECVCKHFPRAFSSRLCVENSTSTEREMMTVIRATQVS